MTFWSRNIETKGRMIRFIAGVLLVIAAVAAWWQAYPISALILAGSAAFVLFEAARGWCFLRACGLKTKF